MSEQQPVSVSYLERVENARTAYLSIPTYLKSKQSEVLTLARLVFPQMRIGNFETEFDADEFKSWSEWKVAFKEFVADCDVLIVACDESRLITRGVRGEVDIARQSGKTVVILKTDDKQSRRYWGYERMPSGGRLYKREEGVAVRAKLRAAKIDAPPAP